jgi:hypothetical protein
MDLEPNLRSYLDGGTNSDGREPNERYASFDYCFNYFQSFRDSGNVSVLANSANIQLSCLHLGFYLASWGMFRGSAELLQKSARCLIPVIEAVARTDASFWEIDADCYTEPNIQRLLAVAGTIRDALPGMSPTLLTKIMLGVFGSVPAFDTNFRAACKGEGIVQTFGSKALRKIGTFYKGNAAVIDAHRVPTLDFISGGHTQRCYTRAKVIDMAFFIEGEKRLEQAAKLAKLAKLAAVQNKLLT